MDKGDFQSCLIKTKALEDYSVVAVRLKSNKLPLWRKVKFVMLSLTSSKLLAKSMYKIYQRKVETNLLKGSQLELLSSYSEFEFSRPNSLYLIWLAAYSRILSLLLRRNYCRVYSELIQAINKQIVLDMQALANLKSGNKPISLSQKAKQLMKKSDRLLTRVALEELVEDFESSRN